MHVKARITRLSRFLSKLLSRYSLLIIIFLAVLIGLWLSKLLVPKPVIGIVEISGAVQPFEVSDIVAALVKARENRSIKAVVLELDSPGGIAADIEEIYLNVLELKKDKPVVTAIGGIAVSGGYYIAIATNWIYAKPSSDIGGVGVISKLPKRVELEEDLITTGPFKRIGIARKDYAYQVQQVAESFYNAVLEQRGQKLKLAREELAKAQIYTGMDAVRLGLIDAIGSRTDAIEKAAELAGLRQYDVVKFRKPEYYIVLLGFQANESIINQTSNTVPVNYYLYLAHAERAKGEME